VLAACLILARAATAQVPTPAETPSSPELAEARGEFEQGVGFAKEERWLPALLAFERSQALHAHAITAYDIAYCERALGHLTRARARFEQALADNLAHGEAELPAELEQRAREYRTEADRQLAVVVVSLGSGAIAVDGRPLEVAGARGGRLVLLAGTRNEGPAEVAPASTFEAHLDPGTHVFALSVDGQPDVVVSRTLAPGANPPLELRGAGGREPSSRQPARLAIGPTKSAPATTTAHAWPALAFGVGAAGVLVGSVSGLLAFSHKSSVHDACASAGADATQCGRERDSAHRAADISTGSFIVGGAASVVGAVLLFATRGDVKPTSGPSAQLAAVRPLIGWATLGAEGHFWRDLPCPIP
jgi:hypothetical protein